MDEMWKRIETVAKDNNGFIKTAQVEEVGISRPMLKKFVDAGHLKKVRKGLYVLADELVDEYALVQAQSSTAVFAYGTALYLWGMSDRVPNTLDVVVPSGSNVSRLKKNNPHIRCHYVTPKFYDVGITQTQTPLGATVRLYDKERCICDLIRSKDDVEMQLFTQAIKDYFKNKPNNRKILKYGKLFGIEEKIRTYVEVL